MTTNENEVIIIRIYFFIYKLKGTENMLISIDSIFRCDGGQKQNINFLFISLKKIEIVK